MKKTQCLFAVNEQVCTRANVIDKMACSEMTLEKGYDKWVYLYSREEALEFVKQGVIEKIE